MILEEYVDKGIIFTMLMKASMRTSITFDNGQIIVGNKKENTNYETYGTRTLDYNKFDLITASDAAWRIGALNESYIKDGNKESAADFGRDP